MSNDCTIHLGRVASIDVFRALTMFLMIFVNDFWTLSGVPKALQHAGANDDFIGFSDVIFPAFLFIVGLSIPLAVTTRRKKRLFRPYHLVTYTSTCGWLYGSWEYLW